MCTKWVLFGITSSFREKKSIHVELLIFRSLGTVTPGRKWRVLFSSARCRVQRQVESVNKAARERPRGRDLNLYYGEAGMKVAIVHFLSVLRTDRPPLPTHSVCRNTWRKYELFPVMRHFWNCRSVPNLSSWGPKAKHKREFLIGTTNSTTTTSPQRPLSTSGKTDKHYKTENTWEQVNTCLSVHIRGWMNHGYS